MSPTKHNGQNARDVRRAATRMLLEIFFFTFALLLIKLPPDVYGDRILLPYFLILTASWFLARSAARRGAFLSPLAPLRKRLWLIIFYIPVGGYILYFTGIFVGILFALWPQRFVAACVAIAALWVVQHNTRTRALSSRPPHIRALNMIRITPARAWFILVWVSLISYIMLFKTSSESSCATVPAPGVRLVLSKRQMDSVSELQGMFPYMAEPDASGRNLYVSFKPDAKQFFRIARLKLDVRGRSALQILPLPPGGDIGMVQAIALDRARGRLYVPVVFEGSFRMLVVDAGDGPLRLIKTVPVPGEVGDIVIDQARSLLHISIKPNRLVTYRLPSLEVERDRPAPVSGGIDFLAVEPRTGDLFLSTVGLHLARESRATHRFVKTFMLSSFGMAPARGGKNGLLFAASPGTGRLYALDPLTLRTVYPLAVDYGLRAVTASTDGRLVFAASYADGNLHILDATTDPPSQKAKLFLGSMLRRVTTSPSNGRIYAASTCGVAEVDPAIVVK